MKIVAEIGINHNGDLDIAKKLIDVAHSAGCDFVKFQKRSVYKLFSLEELEQPKDSPWGTTYGEYKERLEFNKEDFKEIDRYCRDRIGWFVSAWDVGSLMDLSLMKDFPYIKVASAMLTDIRFLEMAKAFNIPVILSTGMSDLAMIDKAVDVLGKDRIEYILQCTSTYPSKATELNVRCIPMLKEKYPFAKIGFSNHYPGLLGMVVAASLGAEMIEFHITLDRAMYGTDQAASVEPEGVHKICKYLRQIEPILGGPEKAILPSEMPIIEKLRR
jgi:N-acetylneuraminate synthase